MTEITIQKIVILQHNKKNSANQNKLISNTSGYIGVTKDLRKEKGKTKPWYAKLRTKPKRICVGYFSTALEAAIARDKYIKDNNLPHMLNFK